MREGRTYAPFRGCTDSRHVPHGLRRGLIFRPYGLGLLAALLEELGYQAGPAGLVVGAQAGAGVAVEVFVEQNRIAPVRVGVETTVGAVYGTAAGFVLERNARETTRDFGGDFPQREHLAAAGGTFDFVIVA